MKPAQLSQYENAAVTRAKEACVNDFMGAIFDIMWNEGVHSLEDLDAPKFELVLTKARTDKHVQAAFEKYMTEYSAYLDKIMSGELPPF